MKIYHYHPETGLLLGTSIARIDPVETQLRFNATGVEQLVFQVPANATTIEPPEPQPGFATFFNGTQWESVEDHRGKTIYSTLTGIAETVTTTGALPAGFTLLPPATPYDQWNGSAWETDHEQLLLDAKNDKRRLNNALAEAALSTILNAYPAAERISWNKQEEEALLLQSNPQASTPLLAGIATARGIPLAELATRVLANSAAFVQISGQVFGLRQKYEDQIDDAETVADLELITLTY